MGGSSVSDPHAYFSRPGSSQSYYGGRGGFSDKGMEEFRSKLEAAQMEDDSPPQGRRPAPQTGGLVLRSASGQVIRDEQQDPFTMERPGSAMSEMSEMVIPGMTHDTSRPGSRMGTMETAMLGDEVSHSLLDLSAAAEKSNLFAPSPSHGQKPDFGSSGNRRTPDFGGHPAGSKPSSLQPDYGLDIGPGTQDDLDEEIVLGEEAATPAAERAATKKQQHLAAEKAAEEKKMEARKQQEEKERHEKEKAAQKIKLEKEAKEEEKRKAEEKKAAELELKKQQEKLKKEEEEVARKEAEMKKKEEEKQKQLEAKAKKEAEEKKKEEEKLAKEAEKKAKLEEKKRKMEEAKEKKRLEEEEAKEKKRLLEEEAKEKKRIQEEEVREAKRLEEEKKLE